MATGKKKELSRGGGLLAQWAGFLLGPIAWALQLQVALTLVPWACAHDVRAMSLHIVTLAALLLTILGGFIAWRCWQRAGQQWPERDAGGTLQRSRFMAVLGLLTSAFFFLVILVQGIPSFILHPCQR